MEAVLKREVHNSELAVPKEKRAFLTYPADGLAACGLEETEDGIVFLLDTNGLSPAAEILGKPREDKLRFLINCAALGTLYREYVFSLSPDNLMTDINLRPRVLARDARLNAADDLSIARYAVGSIQRNGNTVERRKMKTV